MCLGWAFAFHLSCWAQAQDVDYAKDIKAVFVERCVACHGSLKSEGGLRLDAASLITKGGDSGEVLVAGKPDDSELVRRVRATDDDRMPPEGEGSPLTKEQIDLLQQWIAGGAVMPAQEAIPIGPQDHWAFQRPLPTPPPETDAKWVRNDLDRFTARRLEANGLTPAGEADRSVLQRRVYLDLIGVPPTRQQRDAYLTDISPQAHERMIDQLLESPLYGQRWARHWMDVWRYSDPSGYGAEIRDGRQHIWHWRDWIVESLNEDVGYDQMIVEMLAADEAYPDDLSKARATGYLARNWYKFNRNVWLDNIVEHSSKAFLGLTSNCSRCHDHKYDPISHDDYYALRAIFETHDVRDTPDAKGATIVQAYDVDVARPTYLFLQGNEKKPDKTRVLSPAIPDFFSGEFEISPVPLPVTAFYPALRPTSHRQQLDQLKQAVVKAESELGNATDQLAAIHLRMKTERPEPHAPAEKKSPIPAKLIQADGFEKLDPQSWEVVSGNWTADGVLRQSEGNTIQHRLVSQHQHPSDFAVKATLRITGGEMWRSVGIGFDLHGQQMSAVYLSAFADGTKVQVSTQDDTGKWNYPSSGAKSFMVDLNQDYVVELRVRDQTLNVLIDGEFVVAFQLPATRRPGKISLWAFSATAEFRDYKLTTLPSDLAIVPATGAPKTVASLEAQLDQQTQALVLSRRQIALASSDLASYEARYSAESRKYGLTQNGDLAELTREAIALERAALLANLEVQIADLTAKRNTAVNSAKPVEKEIAERAKKINDLQQKQKKLQAAMLPNVYSPLGTVYPNASSGRRLAYARWITETKNPLTARVAVNHVWRHHFGTPLVERVFDFGLRSPPPLHQDVLDWLAIQFVNEGWSMKQLHRIILTSATYRRESTIRDLTKANVSVDQDNHFWWRTNVRRMDAEVVRDSLLYLGGQLDSSEGGAPLQHDQGQTTYRRSLYYRHDKERQMTFLNLFDGANVNECYERKPTVSPQQALAMYNSQLADKLSRELASKVPGDTGVVFVTNLFRHVVSREPTAEELAECTSFFADFGDAEEAKYQLALVLLNHNDFVTIR